jgi:hypothetical protein
VKKQKKTAAPKKAAKKTSAAKTATAGTSTVKTPKVKPPTPKTAAAKPAAPKAKNGFHPGIYTVPRGHVSIAVPTFWSLRQTNDDVQVESEASETTVIVTAYQRNDGVKPLDARDYLKHFLDTAPVAGRLQKGDSTKQHATARFRDEEGDNWFVRFLSNGQTLLLATCHSNRPLTSREGKTGMAVLESIKLKARV